MQLHHWSTAKQSRHHLSKDFRTAMAQWFDMPLAISSGEHASMDIDLLGFSSPIMAGAALSFSPHVIKAASHRRRANRLLISFQKTGVARFAQDGRDCIVGPGQWVLIDPARPFLAESEQISCHSIYISRCAVQTLHPYIEHCTARAFNSNNPTGTMLSTIVDQLINASQTLDEQTLQLVAASIPTLVGAALRWDCASPVETLAARNRLSEIHRVLNFIDENLCDPELAPGMIAKGVGISKRQLHTLFASRDCTLMREVCNRRLERCRRDLGDPLLASRAVSEVGRDWGFDDPARFSRTFRKAFGYSPCNYRKRALAGQLLSLADA